MTSPEQLVSRTELTRLHARLRQWLVEAAYPVWAARGSEPAGGFLEAIAQDGSARPGPRRARVAPRQVYAFAQAPRFGWRGDATGIVRRGVTYYADRHRRPDGLFRTLTGANGAPLDERALLYDQAFALLGFASAASALDARNEFEPQALELRHAVERSLSAADGAFRSSEEPDGPRESNPHMHLLEACLAWAEIGNDAGWARWARDLISLALSRFIHAESGALGECFEPTWGPLPGIAGRIVEPGHQFEWAWLLLRSEARHAGPLRKAALRLIDIGERAGVHGPVAVNALLDDFTVHDPNARFWPQTERLKAGLLAAQLTDEPKYWSMAQAAASSFLPYLATPIAGLWFDVQRPDGSMVDAPAPASSFYHVVCALKALHEAMGEAAPEPRPV